ncbi:MAG: hydroxymethylglutaryl-CoA lyase [Chitinophagaceae bacterium]
MQHELIHFVECPRDAMQGWKPFIPTDVKVAYLNALLQVGFDTIDFGSFVSPAAIPQMADTASVINRLDLTNTRSRLLAIVANVRGAEQASAFPQISCLGFPFSVSETFQQRNTNSSIGESLIRVEKIQDICVRSARQLVVYVSMGFGNPYGDPYNEDTVLNWVNKLAALGVKVISLADTVGLAEPEQVNKMVSYLVKTLPLIDTGVHLHSAPTHWKEKVQAALDGGCRRFDGALKGIGGCPMADDVLVGNLDTEKLVPYFKDRRIMPDLNQEGWKHSLRLAEEIFRM